MDWGIGAGVVAWGHTQTNTPATEELCIPAPLPFRRRSRPLLDALRDRRAACYANAMTALILSLIEAAAHWPPRGALIGLDLGTKTIGVAVSDPDRRLATGVETIQRKAFKADAARLLVIAA